MSMLGSFLSVLISPFGMLAYLIGLVLFWMLPMVPRVTNYFQGFARLHLWFGARMLKRASIVLSEHGDLILKRMSPDDIGTETISFNDDQKEFEDQNERKAKSHWMGIPFGMADEVHGFIFTPLDAAFGARKAKAEKADEMVVKATAEEQEQFDVLGWVRGVFEFPENTYELVDLNMVRQLVSGSERAEHPQRVNTFYKLSREPYNEGASAKDMILIIVAMLGPFAGIWVLASQFGISGAGAGGPSSSVSFGLLYLLASGAQIDRRKLGIGLAVFGPFLAVFVLLAIFVSPIYSALLLIVMALGFGTSVFIIEILKISTAATNSLSGLLLKTGFFGYDEPVWEYTPRGYNIREFNKLDVDEDKIVWHTFLGRRFGFTFTPTPANWGDAVADTEDLEDRVVGVGDSAASKTNIPSGYRHTQERTRAAYGDIVPKRFKRSKYYVNVGVALERMKNVATGEKSHERLTQSKEEHGGTGGISEGGLGKLILAASTLSFLAGIGIFIVPAFL